MEVVANFPVYRTYVAPSGVSDNDAEYIHRAIALAKARSPAADTSVFDFVREVLLTRIAEGQDSAYRKVVTGFAMKFQQFTSPVMAKGWRTRPSTATTVWSRSTTLAAILNGSESQPLIFTRPTSNVFAIGLTPCWRPVRTTRSVPKTCARVSTCYRRFLDYGGFGFGTGDALIASIGAWLRQNLPLPLTMSTCSIKHWLAHGRQNR